MKFLYIGWNDESPEVAHNVGNHTESGKRCPKMFFAKHHKEKR